MEIKEAIEHIKNLQCWIKERHKWYEALNIAVSALEKQIPEPSKVAEGNDVDGIWRPDMFFCPTCGKVIDPCEHHCICGQKIDWED